MGRRFWEFYLVRYLLGTMFGVFILFYLITNYNDELSRAFFSFEKNNETTITTKQNFGAQIYSFLFESTYSIGEKEVEMISKNLSNYSIYSSGEKNKFEFKQTSLTVLSTIILGVCGFLYMYFSSMLILVLHGIRYILFNGDSIKFMKNNKWNEMETFIRKNFFCFVFKIIIVIIFFNIIDCIFNSYLHAISITFFALYILFMISSFGEISDFYKTLSVYRSNNDNKVLSEEKLKESTEENVNLNNQVSEYVESYRHLREHGNAFGIIICEFLFAFWLIWWDFSFEAIFYWCLLGFTSWFLGTYLEMKIVNINKNVKS